MNNEGRHNNNELNIFDVLRHQKSYYKGRERSVVSKRRKQHRENPENEHNTFVF